MKDRDKKPVGKGSSPEYPAIGGGGVDRRAFFALLGGGAAMAIAASACGSRMQPLPGAPPRADLPEDSSCDVGGVDAGVIGAADAGAAAKSEPVHSEPQPEQPQPQPETPQPQDTSGHSTRLPLSGVLTVLFRGKRDKFSAYVVVEHESPVVHKHLVDNSYDYCEQIERLLKRKFTFHKLQTEDGIQLAEKKIGTMIEKRLKKAEPEVQITGLRLIPQRWETDEPLMGLMM